MEDMEDTSGAREEKGKRKMNHQFAILCKRMSTLVFHSIG